MSEETLPAARLLAIVWHRHTALGNSQTTLDEHLSAIKTGLRNQAGKLAPTEIIEAYMLIIEHSQEELHAEIGKIKGGAAIHEILTWNEDGEYVAEPEDKFPPETIKKSSEAILMDGCRLLDESLV
jgi:hypothetical protein